MSALLRWFSPAYRYALRAEAEGRYIEAARAYALCGQRHKVAEMHLLEAERRGSPASALRELHVAAHFLDDAGASQADRHLLKRLGQAYLRALRKSVLTESERELCHEAAALLLRAGDAAGAGAAYELGGDIDKAAAAYAQAGDPDKVEALLEAQQRARGTSMAERERFEAHRTHLLLGRRDEALAALRGYAEVAADRADALRRLDELAGRLLTGGVVRLRRLGPGDAAGADAPAGGAVPGGETLLVGAFPVVLGRGDTDHVTLRDPGVSRAHAHIERRDEDGGPAFLLCDRGSKNGTTLSGLPIGSSEPLRLRDTGEIGIGANAALRFTIGPGPAGADAPEGELRLEVTRGLERGLHVRAAAGPFRLDEGAELGFERGRPLLRAAAGGLVLNGQRAPEQIQLIRGDVVELAGRRYEVR